MYIAVPPRPLPYVPRFESSLLVWATGTTNDRGDLKM